MNDEIATTAIEMVMEELKAAWMGSRPDDAAGREDTFKMVRAVGMLVNKLQTLASNGRLEKQSIARETAEQAGHGAFH